MTIANPLKADPKQPQKPVTKFCKDCRGYHPGVTKIESARCDLVPATLDLVTGQSHPAFCVVARDPGGTCGPDGKFWVARETGVENK